MRVTNRLMTNNIINRIQNNLDNLNRTQEQISANQRILRPSDDPNVLGQFYRVTNTLSYNEQYNNNINDGLSYLNMNDTAMGTIKDVLDKAYNYAMQAANDSCNAEDRIAIGEQIDKMIDQLVDLANSSAGGKYIYAGTDNASPPFVRQGDKIIYNGDYNGIYREVSASTDYRIDAPGVTTGVVVEGLNASAKSQPLPTVQQRQSDHELVGVLNMQVDTVANQVTITGSMEDGTTINTTEALTAGIMSISGGTLDGLQIDFSGSANGAEYSVSLGQLGVFGHADSGGVVYDPADTTKATADKGMFDALFALRDRLYNDDTDGLETSIADIQDKTDRLLQKRVVIGARTKHFEALQSQLEDQGVNLNEVLKNIAGADIAKLSVDISQYELSYNASLSVCSTVMQTSLLNFLK